MADTFRPRPLRLHLLVKSTLWSLAGWAPAVVYAIVRDTSSLPFLVLCVVAVVAVAVNPFEKRLKKATYIDSLNDGADLFAKYLDDRFDLDTGIRYSEIAAAMRTSTGDLGADRG